MGTEEKFEAECNECEWIGFIVDMKTDFDEIKLCPCCGTNNVYFF